MSFSSLTAELVGSFQGLSQPLAATYVKRAWRDIRDARLWSFLMTEGVIVCPPQVTAGRASVTRFSATVTFDATATTALAPFIMGTPLLTQMQFRTNGGEVYSIASVTTQSPLVVELDRVVQETTAALQTYQVYRCYITPPDVDFMRFESLDDFVNGYTITKDRLTRSTAEFDRRDPQRQAQSQAYYLGSWTADSTGRMRYELWPHPTQGQTWVTQYRRRGADFSLTTPSEVQPNIIPDALIIERAEAWYVYPWIQANRGRLPAYNKVDFSNLVLQKQRDYRENLARVIKDDDEVSLQSVLSRGRRGRGGRDLLGPADAKFWQSHAINW